MGEVMSGERPDGNVRWVPRLESENKRHRPPSSVVLIPRNPPLAPQNAARNTPHPNIIRPPPLTACTPRAAVAHLPTQHPCTPRAAVAHRHTQLPPARASFLALITRGPRLPAFPRCQCRRHRLSRHELARTSSRTTEESRSRSDWSRADLSLACLLRPSSERSEAVAVMGGASGNGRRLPDRHRPLSTSQRSVYPLAAHPPPPVPHRFTGSPPPTLALLRADAVAARVGASGNGWRVSDRRPPPSAASTRSRCTPPPLPV